MASSAPLRLRQRLSARHHPLERKRGRDEARTAEPSVPALELGSVRVDRQAVVGVFFDPVVHLSGLLHRIDVDYGERQILQVM